MAWTKSVNGLRHLYMFTIGLDHKCMSNAMVWDIHRWSGTLPPNIYGWSRTFIDGLEHCLLTSMNGPGHFLLASMDGLDQECKGSNGPGHSWMVWDISS